MNAASGNGITRHNRARGMRCADRIDRIELWKKQIVDKLNLEFGVESLYESCKFGF
jgi:hypothetical protein